MTRYVVQTCTGWRKPSTHGNPGLTASVHDSLVCYRTVGLFASEECIPGSGGSAPPKYYGHDGAIAAAQALAERLERRLQLPACDRCTQGVMDATNSHYLGLCRCECHDGR